MSAVHPWFIRMLGRLEILQGQGQPKALRNGRDASLLAFLAFHRETEHSRERLAELFWGEQQDAAALLRGSLTRLRRHLEQAGTPSGTVLVTGRSQIALNREVVNTDVVEFKRLWQLASAAPTPRKIAPLSEAVALYRGELLPLQTEDWIIGVREELAHRHYVMLRQLTQLCEENGQRDQAIAYALAAITASGEDEAAYIDLMRLYGAEGRSREALSLFRKLTRKRSGSPLSEEVRSLASQLQRHPEQLRRPVERRLEVPTDLDGNLLEVSGHKPLNPNLPRPVTRFFGRQKELESLTQMLTGPLPRRLVTLIGMGGLGKSRLTLEVAHRFPGSVFYAELAAPAGKDELLAALLTAVDPRGECQQEDPLERLVAAISKVSTGRVLLILDNAELTTTEAARQVIAPLLTRLANLI
ncbi:BTAD domain-containing putative transcriptional regulator, partial [Armatimonas sp.]|uniref:AfsR/SARP family transcriptional regulator n=1 Tax=Armatimonas sp. TaxID=1872638 RepID=UPI003750BA7B